MSAVGSAAEVSAQGGFGDWLNGIGGALHSVEDIVGSGLGIVNDFRSIGDSNKPTNPSTFIGGKPGQTYVASAPPGQTNWLMIGIVALVAYVLIKKL